MSNLDVLQRQVNQLQADVDYLREKVEAQPLPEDDGLFPEEVRRQDFYNAVPAWSADETYAEDALVKHDGKIWIALPDVANFAPDETYDLDADPQTGGWAPFDY